MTAQSEAALETGLIETLKQMDYEYVQIGQRSLTRYSSTLKVTLVSRKPRNFVTFTHWTLPTTSAFG